MKKTKQTALGPLRILLSLIFAVLSLLMLVWVGRNIHPDSGTATEAAVTAGKRYDLSSRLSSFTTNSMSSALSDLVYIPKVYTIPETDLAAPKPDPGAFGTTTDPEVINALIAAHADLIGDQKMVWNPAESEFLPGSEFQYYADETILVICWKEVKNGTCLSFAEVKIADGSQLRRKIADDTYSSSIQLYASDMAKQANAVVAINGDFYAFRNLGITVYQRTVYRCNPAQVESCFFTASGDMLFSRKGELRTQAEAQQFVDDNDVVFGIAFGPILVDNGELQNITTYPIGEVDAWYSRAAIGMTDELHYLLMAINSEGDAKLHATIHHAAQYMYDKGCQKAYALDGGQTCIIVMNGSMFNNVDWSSERTMSDIIYFGTAVPSGEG